MMLPVINKFLDLLMKFGRDRDHFLFSFNPKAEEINRVLLPSLASFAAWLSTEAAGQSKRAFHHIRQLLKEAFLSHRHSHDGLLITSYMLPYTEYTTKEGVLSSPRMIFSNGMGNLNHKSLIHLHLCRVIFS